MNHSFAGKRWFPSRWGFVIKNNLGLAAGSAGGLQSQMPAAGKEVDGLFAGNRQKPPKVYRKKDVRATFCRRAAEKARCKKCSGRPFVDDKKVPYKKRLVAFDEISQKHRRKEDEHEDTWN